MYVYSLQLILYKFHHGTLPCIFADFFTTNSLVHNYSTRQADLLHVPLVKYKPALISVKKNGVKSYNHFYNKIELNRSLASYKYHLKQHILKNGVAFMSV